MTNEVVTERKAILAKLLAQENITIEFRNITTAMFDIETRVLVLPNMKDDLSPELYNLFIGHEVGHALFTPPTYATSSGTLQTKTEKMQHMLLNIVEDIRIERMIQQKYPGLKRDFSKGYQELYQKDFFHIKERGGINNLGFLDRLNIFAKCGVHSGVTFSPEEQVMLDKSLSLQSFKDVLTYRDELWTYATTAVSHTHQNDLTNDNVHSLEDDDTSTNNEPPIIPPESAGPSYNIPKVVKVKKPKQKTEPENKKDEDDASNKRPGGVQAEYFDDEDEDEILDNNDETKEQDHIPEIITDQALRENIEKFLQEQVAGEIFTLNIPKFNLANIIVDWKLFSKTIHDVASKCIGYDVDAKRLFDTYKSNNLASIKCLVKEFELKKNAKQTLKTQIYKTGQLDAKKLAQYQLTDDIFKRNTIVPGGQSHGLVLFIDWSSSMSSYIHSCLHQLFCLTDFCRQQSIPFEVYAFRSGLRYQNSKEEYYAQADFGNLPINKWQTTRTGDIDFHNFHLVNFLSSKMSYHQYITTQKNILFVNQAYDYYVKKQCWMTMGGTPLNNSIAAAMDIIPTFQKANGLQIVNSVFITDGDSDWINNFFAGREESTNYFPSGSGIIYIRDPISKAMEKINHCPVGGGHPVTRELLLLLQKRTNANIIGFFLTDASEQKLTKKYNHPDNAKAGVISWTKDGYLVQYGLGYTEHYSVRTRNLQIAASDLDSYLRPQATINKKSLEKAFLSKNDATSKNRTMLLRFIKLIS